MIIRLFRQMFCLMVFFSLLLVNNQPFQTEDYEPKFNMNDLVLVK